MTPLIYHPDMTKLQLWLAGVLRIGMAAVEWNVPVPIIHDTTREGSYRYGTGGTLFGEFVPPHDIYVNLKRATTPPKVRGMVWSYPGHKTDRTCTGILAHEFGHHIAHHVRMDALSWMKIVKATKSVTSYEPTFGEAFAESMRIYIWNPDLLRRGRPERYEYISSYFRPLHTALWSDVLANAPDFIKESAGKWPK